MSLSYRSRRRIKKTFTTLAVIAVIALVAWLIWIVWVGRYIVYTPEGARLDFSIDPTFPSGEVATAPEPAETVEIIFDILPPEETTPIVEEDPQLKGYYIDLDDLKTDISTIRTQLEQLPAGTAVLLDVKDHTGYFFTSSLGTTASAVDTAQMDQLISWLGSSQLHTIARLPALRDRAYALTHVEDGLPKDDGSGELWADEDGHFWLDPTAQGTLDHLTQVVRELQALGFDEVMFTQFHFPETDELAFEGDRTQALADAAAALVTSCTTEDLWLTFEGTADFPLPAGNARLCMQDVPASRLHEILAQAAPTDPAQQLMFLTESPDTRFDQYCVLRPLEDAQ